MCHVTEQWCKIWWRTYTCCCKNEIRNLANFYASTQMSRNWYFDGLLLSKVYWWMSEKIREDLCVITLQNDAKFEAGWLFVWKVIWENWSQNFYFEWVLMSKVSKEWVKNLHSSNASWYQPMMLKLRNNLLVLAKMA